MNAFIKKGLKIGLTLVCFMLICLITWAVRSAHPVQYNLPLKPKAPPLKPVFDTRLLAKLNQLARMLDMNKPCAYKATLSITDRADTANNVSNVPILFFKNGNTCYYSYGHTEMLNAEGLNIYVSHEQQRILIGRQKSVSTSVVGDLAAFTAGLSSENYTISASKEGVLKTIKLQNERHIACKEYAMTYDTVSGIPTRLLARLAAVQDPMDAEKERIMDMRIQTWNATPDRGKYPLVSHYIKIIGQQITTVAPYKDYELINTLK